MSKNPGGGPTVKRIQSGLHGPTLLLSADWEERAAWDDVVIECHTDRDGAFRVTVTKNGAKVLNHRLSGVTGAPQKGWSQK